LLGTPKSLGGFDGWAEEAASDSRRAPRLRGRV